MYSNILFYFFLLLLGVIVKSEISFRLPNSTIPRFYSIYLEPRLFDKKFSFSGRSFVDFAVIKPTKTIILHKSEYIQIDGNFTKVGDGTGKEYSIHRQLWLPEQEFFMISVRNKLQVGNYTLKLRWKNINDSNKNKYTGFYRAVDYDNQNKPQYLVATNLQGTNARSVFPCWDEPGYRAIYKISVKHPYNYHALSNMPKDTTRVFDNNNVITTFQESVPISSYQVCVVIANYDSSSNFNGNLTVHTKKNHLNFLKHVSHVQAEILPIIENYIGIPYILPKLDSVTIPQFMKTSVAASTPGLITYKSEKVKLISKNSTIVVSPRKISISQHAVYEILQQWFDNLVSPAWWNDFWLIKGIPLYLQYQFLEQLYPNLEATNFETIETYQFLFIIDAIARNNLPPLASVPQSQLSIKRKFHFINNMRSFVVTQMLEHVVTPDVFRAGLHNFFENNKFKVVTTDDFWKSLQEAYNKKFINNTFSIKENMDPWLSQPGYPILKVTRDYEQGLVTISQSNALVSQNNLTWNIPITYATRSKPDFESTLPVAWITQNQTSITLKGIAADDWIILNIQQRSYYKVEYDMKNLQLITKYLLTKDFVKIHPINSARIIDDVYDAYQNNNDYFEVAILLIGYLRHETDYIAWLSGTQLIDKIMQSTDIQANNLFKNYINEITKKIITDIDMVESVNDSAVELRLKREVLSLYCRFNYDECKTRAYEIYNSSITEPSAIINMNAIYPWVMCNVFEDFNITEWDKLFSDDFAIFKDIPQEKFMYLQCAKSNEVLKKYLDYIVRQTDSNIEFETVFDNIIQHTRNNNVKFLLQYFIENFDIIQSRFLRLNNLDAVPLIIKKLIYYIDDSDDWKKFIVFITSRSTEFNNKYSVYKRDVIGVISSLADKNDYENDSFEFIYETLIELWRSSSYEDTSEK